MVLSENELIILKSYGLSSCHIYDSWGYVPFSHKAYANGSSMLQSFMTTLAVWRTAMGQNPSAIPSRILNQLLLPVGGG